MSVRFRTQDLLQLEQSGQWRRMREMLDAVHTPEPAQEADFLFWKGVVLGRLGKAEGSQYSQELARGLLSKAADLYSGNDDKAACLSRAAMCHWREGALGKAEAMLAEAQGLAESDYNRAIILINTSIVLKERGRLDGAWVRCAEAQPLSTDLYTAALLALEQGTVNHFLGNYDESFSCTNRAIKHFGELGHKPYLALGLNNKAATFTKLGKFGESRNCLDEAQEIAMDLYDPGLLALIATSWGDLYAAATSPLR